MQLWASTAKLSAKIAPSQHCSVSTLFSIGFCETIGASLQASLSYISLLSFLLLYRVLSTEEGAMGLGLSTL